MTDPFSTAAGAVGVVSLALQLLGGCIKGFVLLSTAQNIGKDGPTIICMLELQEASLTNWARSSGLLKGNGTLDYRLNSTLIEETLLQLQNLLSDTTSLKKRYGLSLVEEPSHNQKTVSNLDDATLSQLGKVYTSISDKTRKQILLRAKTPQGKNIFKRLWWAAVDKDKIEKLVGDVHFLVRELWNHLQPFRHDDLATSIEGVGAEVLKLNSRFDQLMSLNDAVSSTLLALPPSQGASLKPLAALAEVKALRIGLGSDEQDQATTAGPKRQDLLKRLARVPRLSLTDFESKKKSDDMGLAEYDRQRVFVEWKHINAVTRNKILPRIENLAALLSIPQSGHARWLTCKGIAEQETKVAFIFEHPFPQSPDQPRSLLDLFAPKEKGGMDAPSLSARVKLALQISQIVQALHQTGWLHKNLRSENILFFSAGTEPTETMIESPLLAGFGFARLDSPSEISEQPSADAKRDIYRHPSALGEPSTSYGSVMDAYSLGTILLEIAEWRPLRYLVESVVNVGADYVPLTELAKVQKFLLDGQGKGGSSKLKNRTGDIYADVCLRCLRGETEASREEGELGSEYSLIDTVVHKLGSCII